MAKKIFLSPSNQDKNTYSYGNTTEDVQCGKIAKACEAALKRCGFDVKLEQYDTMQNRVKHSNAWGADLHVPIHTNAFNNKVGGTRVFYYKAETEGHEAAKAVFDALKGLSIGTSDACQQNKMLYEARVPKAPSVYVEAEFHDVPEYAKWIIEHTTEIGEAICKGICAHFGVAYKAAAAAEAPKAESGVTYCVQVGAFSNYDGAKAYLEKVKAAGFDGFIVEKQGSVSAKDPAQIKTGSTVRVNVGARTYTGQRLAAFIYYRDHKVKEIKGDRVVIEYGGTVIAAVRMEDLTLV